MTRKRVAVAKDHVAALIASTPQRAVEEIIWNALDAGGSRVDVTLHTNDLGAVETIEVADQGPGINPTDLDRSFGQIGNSIKVERKQNPDNRAYHGRLGKGRLKARSLGPTVSWYTTYLDQDGYQSYTIKITRDEPDYFEPSESVSSASNRTGTKVTVSPVDKGQLSLANEETTRRLAETFSSYLLSYPTVKLTWDGRDIDVSALIEHETTIPLVDDEHRSGPASLHVVEWRFKPDAKRLHICDTDGFSYFDTLAGVQGRGIEYTAYIRTPIASEWSETARLVSDSLDPEVNELVEIAKEALRDYLRKRWAAQAGTTVEEWKSASVYPYTADPKGPIEVAEREVFDIIAVQINESHPTFQKSDLQHKKLTLALIKQAIESSPENFAKILHEVVSLTSDEQALFADLLSRTPLAKLVRAGNLVADRLDTIQTFEHILFDREWRQRLLERTQLHRLLVHEIWILGEDYAVGGDDEGLRDLLAKHVHLLGRPALAPEVDVKLLDGQEGIPDLMLYRRRCIDRNQFEHVVVELKRPLCKLGMEESSQIKKYAFTVSQDPRFNTRDCRWEFWLLGNELDDYVKNEASTSNLPEGCIYDGNRVRIWAMPWAQVLNNARARYEFFRERLEYEASHERGLEMLKSKYSHLLQGRGVRKAKDLEIMASS